MDDTTTYEVWRVYPDGAHRYSAGHVSPEDAHKVRASYEKAVARPRTVADAGKFVVMKREVRYREISPSLVDIGEE